MGAGTGDMFDKAFSNMEQLKATAEKVNKQMKDAVNYKFHQDLTFQE